MKKEVSGLLVFSMISILLTSGIALAIGSSGGSYQDSGQANAADINQAQANLVDCEQGLATVEERVKCRLQNRDKLKVYDSDSEFGIHESCRRLAVSATATTQNSINRERCRALYSELRPCYALEGRAKDACFRRVSGLGTAAISGEADKQNVKSYIVALLYELEERIELKVEAGSITAEDGAELIALIIEVKEMIMNGEPREDIRDKLAELRQKWNEVANG